MVIIVDNNNKQPINCEVQLPAQLTYISISMMTYKPSKLGQSDLVFVFRLQVYVTYSSYDISHTG